MNIAFPRGRTSHGAPFVATIISATILSVVAGVGVWQAVDSSSSESRAAVNATSRKIELPNWDTRTLVLYLVDTPEMALVALMGEQEAAAERASAGVADPHQVVEVLTMTTAADDAYLYELLEAWQGAPGGVRLVDNRAK